MSQPPAPYTREELASLLAFYADAGLDFPISAEPVDRFSASDSALQPQMVQEPTQQQRRTTPAASPLQSSTPPVVPDTQAIAMAETVAATAQTLDELAAAVADFDGCNLKRSARNTVFEGGNRGAKLMIVQAAPSREDDAAGTAFQGPHGALLRAMFAAIGLNIETDIYTSFCVPWCPPGGQQPTQLHMNICAPFLRRQMMLASPERIVVMGNGPAQMLFNSRKTILRLRGQWQQLPVGDTIIAALPMLPTSILLDEPMLKRNAWIDLLSLKGHLAGAH